MRIAVTGATGFVGHWTVGHLLAAGHEVLALGRRRSAHRAAGYAAYDLDGPPPELAGCHALVHAAFSHVPGSYRGGEGDDPEGFMRRNLEGSARLFEAARHAGVRRTIFLSSRAVYGAYPVGTRLHEGLDPRPDTLYGKMKRAAELSLEALASADFGATSLRVTGVYGPPVPGLPHKWHDLLMDFAAGQTLEPRAGTEVHARDLADAIHLLLVAEETAQGAHVFNVSDFILDRRDLLMAYSRISGLAGQLPDATDRNLVSQMTTDRLESLGWSRTGPAGLAVPLAELAKAMRSDSARDRTLPASD